MRTRTAVLAAMGGCVLIVVVAVVLAVVLVSSGDDQSRATGVLRAYLDDITNHKPAAAYQLVCPGTRARLSEDQWASEVLAFRSYRIVRVQIAGSGGTADVTTDGGSRQYALDKENGHWWVCDPN
jgi:hypothetical protein